MEIITQSGQETQNLAQDVLNKLKETPRQTAAVLALEGELGAGKTTFLQGLAQALGVKDRVLSPTFVIMKKYQTAPEAGFATFYHMDSYRLSGSDDLKDLGFEEILKNPKNLLAVEWAEKIKDALPADTAWIKFEHLEEDKRKIVIPEQGA